jgi:hypothetical protein
MRRPKQDMLGLRMRSRTNAAKMIRIAVVLHFIVGLPASPAAGDRTVAP